MEIVTDLASLAPSGPAVVTVGNFDGVHRGHQALVRNVMERARLHAARGVAVTFDPHPQSLLHPTRAPVPLTSMAEKVELLAELGLERLVVVPFTREVAAIPAESFVTDFLLGKLGARELYVGSNFGFGRGKTGNVALLARMAVTHEFYFAVVDSVTDAGLMISSTRIREMVAAGDLDGAREELGRPYRLRGKVVRGDGRGRTIGFPTANVEGDKPLLLPHGVYAVTARIGDEGAELPGVCNAGTRPTFPGAAPTVEVHVLDPPALPDVTGQAIQVSFFTRLREERAFPDVSALQQQIARDAADARRVLASREVTHAR